VSIPKLLICVTSFLIGANALAATTVILPADQDVTLSELHPSRAETKKTAHSLSAGIGFTTRSGRMKGYMHFQLDEIPRSDWRSDVTIDSAVLKLFVLAHTLTYEDKRYDGKRYLMSVSGCDASSWLETTMSWESRVCADGERPQDAIIIDGEHLPASHDWNVTEQFHRQMTAGRNGVTLIADSQRLLTCSRDPLDGIGCPDFPDQRGFLRFASRERSEFGISVVPRVVVLYSKQPTQLISYIGSTLAILSALGMLLGLYSGVKNLQQRKK
jgi:hypothetical protein